LQVSYNVFSNFEGKIIVLVFCRFSDPSNETFDFFVHA
jgi:hypothetical protein